MNIDYNATIEILKSFLENEKTEILGISVGEERQVRDAIKNLLTSYEKEKEKNDRYFKQNIEYQKTLEKLQKETIWKDKIKEIIYPTPENYISIEVQQSEMYKKLLKEMEE